MVLRDLVELHRLWLGAPPVGSKVKGRLRLGVPQLVSFGPPGMLLGDARLVRGKLGQAKP